MYTLKEIGPGVGCTFVKHFPCSWKASWSVFELMCAHISLKTSINSTRHWNIDELIVFIDIFYWICQPTLHWIQPNSAEYCQHLICFNSPKCKAACEKKRVSKHYSFLTLYYHYSDVDTSESKVNLSEVLRIHVPNF